MNQCGINNPMKCSEPSNKRKPDGESEPEHYEKTRELERTI